MTPTTQEPKQTGNGRKSNGRGPKAILIADDHKLVRELYVIAIRERWPKAAIGHADDVGATLKQLGARKWSVVLLDLIFPGGRSGMEVLDHVANRKGAPPVLVVSAHPEKSYACRCLSAGAKGYVSKTAEIGDFVEAVERVSAGGTYMSRDVASEMINNIAHHQDAVPHRRLTNREYDIFLRIASGRTVTQVAQDLQLSPKTVGTHRANILEKLALPSNTALIRYAFEHGLVT